MAPIFSTKIFGCVEGNFDTALIKLKHFFISATGTDVLASTVENGKGFLSNREQAHNRAANTAF